MNREFEKQRESYLQSIKIRYEKTTKETIRIRRNGLSKFLNFIESKAIESLSGITRDIVSNYSFKLKKPQEELPKDILSEEEVKRILSMPDKRSKNGLRDRTMIEILYGSGLRILELRKLKLCDIDLESGYLFITGKGQKDRVVPMTRTARHYLKRYLEKARPFLLDKEYSTEAVFLNQFGKSFGKNGIGIMIKNYSLKAKIEKNVTPHTFRHSCATHLISRGAGVRYVQELLGHNEINTTQIYTRVMPIDLKRVYEATHPRCLKHD